MEELHLTNLDLTDSKVLAESIVSILDEKKGKDIRLLHVEEKTILADYFVICSGTSNTQIRGLCGEVEFKLAEAGVVPHHTEGVDEGNWIVMDYSSVIVHIFNRDKRQFYNLEKLWNEATETDISELLTED